MGGNPIKAPLAVHIRATLVALFFCFFRGKGISLSRHFGATKLVLPKTNFVALCVSLPYSLLSTDLVQVVSAPLYFPPQIPVSVPPFLALTFGYFQLQEVRIITDTEEREKKGRNNGGFGLTVLPILVT